MIDLFNKTILPISPYGCEIWVFADISQLEVFRRNFLCKILKLTKGVCNCIWFKAQQNIRNVVKLRMAYFWFKTDIDKQS